MVVTRLVSTIGVREYSSMPILVNRPMEWLSELQFSRVLKDGEGIQALSWTGEVYMFLYTTNSGVFNMLLKEPNAKARLKTQSSRLTISKQ